MVTNTAHNTHPSRIAGAARRFWFGRLIAARASDLLAIAGVALLCAGVYDWGAIVFVVSLGLIFVSRTLRIRAWWYVSWKLQGTDQGPTWVRLLPMLTQMLVLAIGVWLMSLSEFGRWIAGPLTAYILAWLVGSWLWSALIDRKDRVRWINLGLATVLGLLVWAGAVALVWPIQAVPGWGTAAQLQTLYSVGTTVIVTVTLLVTLLWKWGTHVPARSRELGDETDAPTATSAHHLIERNHS